jgi:hypothetical protein
MINSISMSQDDRPSSVYLDPTAPCATTWAVFFQVSIPKAKLANQNTTFKKQKACAAFHLLHDPFRKPISFQAQVLPQDIALVYQSCSKPNTAHHALQKRTSPTIFTICEVVGRSQISDTMVDTMAMITL